MEIDPWLPRAAARRPEATALETGGERVSYRELLMAATRAAAGLVTRGAGPGDRVALTLPYGRAYVEAVHGCWLLRALALPVHPRLSERERKEMVRGVDVLVTAPLAGGGAPFHVSEPHADELALIVHTSGTTRAARPVELSFGNLAAHVRASAAAVPLEPDDRWLSPLPLSHVGGLMVLVRCAAAAATVAYEPGPFDADRVAARLRDGEVTIASLVPTMLEKVLEVGGTAGPRLRRVLLGGGPVTRGLLERALQAGFPVAQTYGLTEACSTVTLAETGDVETAGRPLPGIGVAVAADGEILVSGPTVVSEWNPLRTGDLGRLDRDGRLTVTGRKADTIVSGGENIAPAEIEAVLESHPDVAEAGVFARAHPVWGEAVTAKVVPREGREPTSDDLRAHCAAGLAGFKVPKSFELVEALPRTASGKLLRRELRGSEPPARP